MISKVTIWEKGHSLPHQILGHDIYSMCGLKREMTVIAFEIRVKNTFLGVLLQREYTRAVQRRLLIYY